MKKEFKIKISDRTTKYCSNCRAKIKIGDKYAKYKHGADRLCLKCWEEIQ
ncbi:hypothetical protein [Proteiniborus sp.]